jgi:hypothetical protein
MAECFYYFFNLTLILCCTGEIVFSAWMLHDDDNGRLCKPGSVFSIVAAGLTIFFILMTMFSYDDIFKYGIILSIIIIVLSAFDIAYSIVCYPGQEHSFFTDYRDADFAFTGLRIITVLGTYIVACVNPKPS